jgi:hypothetical protein
MEVSDKQTGPGESGQALLDTVASLTGLPEGLVQQELHEMLEVAGQNAGSVTLDQLRQAMLLYLEALALQEESLMGSDGEAGTSLLRASDSGTIPSA